MKKTLIVIVIILLLASIGISCTPDQSSTQLIVDREIQGSVIAIDKSGDYSILSFSNGTQIVITSTSLEHWIIGNMFHNIWIYKFQRGGILHNFQIYYILIGIGDKINTDIVDDYVRANNNP